MQEKSAQYIKMMETPISKLVLSLSVPTIISMLVTSLYNMADTYFVSHLGTDASAAVGIVFSVQSLMQAVGFGLGMGSGSLISMYLGRRDSKTAQKYASSSFAAAFVFGIILLIIAVLDIDNMMLLFGADKNTLPYTRDYGFFILVGAPLMCSSFTLNNTLRSQGKAKLAMIGLTTGGILNILLDPIFIYDRWLGFGTKGAAIATILSQSVSFCILFCLLKFGDNEVKLDLKTVSTKISDYFLIIKTGLPTVCRQGLASVATTLINRQARIYGSAVVAAVTISTKIYLIVRNAVIGIGQGYQPVSGYNYGAKRYDRVKKSFWVATFYGTIIVIAATFVFYFLSDDLIKLFRKDDFDVIKFGSLGLRFYCLSLPFMAYSTYVNQLFQSLGKVKRATFLAACRNGIFYIPLVYILAGLFKIKGILLVQPIADVLTFAVSIPFNILFFKELDSEAQADSALNEQS